MSKSNYYFGQNVYGQVLSLIPVNLINKITKKSGSDYAIKKLTTRTHLYVMCYAVMNDITGLRHICDGLIAMGNNLSQIGLEYVPPKSTLSDGNKKRSSDVFAQIYMALYQHYYQIISDRTVTEPLLAHAYAIDATTMPLFKAILKASGRKSKDGNEKGGIKAHVQIRLIDELPMNVKHTSGATNDHTFLKDLELKPHDIAIFDKAYVDYPQYACWNKLSIYFVTREKDNAKSITIWERELPDDKDFEVLLDEEVMKTYKDENKQQQQMLLRRTVIWSEKHQDTIVLLSNCFHLKASEISMLYRKRWRIELLFKQLKQNFPLKYFVGDNQNAIEIQIWCVLIVNLLFTVIRLQAGNEKMSFALLTSIIRQHTSSHLNILKYISNPDGLRKEYESTIKSQKNTGQTKIVFNSL